MRRVLQGIVTLLISTSVYCRQCSNSRVAPRYQEKFSNMNDGDLIVEARYRHKRNTFQVIRLWSDDGESTDLNDQIKVHSDDPCFNELSNERYLLALRKDASGFSSLLPPLPIKKSTKRHEIWSQWCSASTHNCKLSISRVRFPSLIIFDRSQMVIIDCHVSSRHALTSIRWKKDGLDIHEKEGNVYAGNDIFVNRVNLEEGISELVIASASSLHTGVYSCVASDESGDRVEMKSQITLRGDNSAFNTCPAGKENYCISGTCYEIKGIPGEVACLCQPGFSDARCQSMDVLHPELPSIDPKDNVERLEHTLVILSIVAILTGICLVLALISLCRVRKRRRSSNDYEAPTENDKTADTDIETASENLPNV